MLATIANHKQKLIKNVRLSVAVLFILSILAQLVDNAFNLITVNLKEEFDLNDGMDSWIASIAGIGLAIGFLAFSSFCDFFNEKRILWVGLFLFIAPSIIGLALQKYFYAVLIARFLQAAGGIATSAIYLVLITRYLPTNEKMIWMGLSTTSFMFSTILGTLVGGFLTENFGWQVIFYIPFFAILGIPFLWKTMPENTKNSGKIEPIIFIILMAMAIALNLVASMPTNYILWIITIIIVPIFLIYVFKSKRLAQADNPVVSKEMLKNKKYMFSLLVTFFYYLAQVAVVVILPFLFKNIYQQGADKAALNYIIPYSIAALIGVFAGKIIKKIGSNYALIISAILIVSGFFLLGLLVDKGIAIVQLCFTLIVAGYALSFVPFLNRSVSYLPEKQIGTGVGLFNFVLRIALAIGISIALMLFSAFEDANFLSYTKQGSDIFTIIFWILGSFSLIGTILHFLPIMLKKESMKEKK